MNYMHRKRKKRKSFLNTKKAIDKLNKKWDKIQFNIFSGNFKFGDEIFMK